MISDTPARRVRIVRLPRTVSLRLRSSSARLQLVSVGTIVALFVAWYLVTDAFHLVSALNFPSIGQTLTAASNLNWTLAHDAYVTAWRVVVSWAIGSALGILTGLAMAKSKLVFHVLAPLVEGLRPVPIIAMIPFTLLWFGLTNTGRIVLGALICFMILTVSTIGAAAIVSPVQVRAARSLGANGIQVYRTIVLPAIFPSLVSALRVAAGFAWTVIVAAEFLGAQNGIGYLMLQASNSLNTPVVLVGTITVGLEAFLFEQILRRGTNRLTRWVDRVEQ
jgi:ABC-type nitrate/sulfonate/bicarbonate transport system permease component